MAFNKCDYLVQGMKVINTLKKEGREKQDKTTLYSMLYRVDGLQSIRVGSTVKG